jgi:predicted RNA-binding Zn-ribbon protein involved in translation (DUF1610 family)
VRTNPVGVGFWCWLVFIFRARVLRDSVSSLLASTSSLQQLHVFADTSQVRLSCGYSIPPAEIQLISTEEMKCPKCGSVFVAGKASAGG